jgi:nicotinamide-nucleotide adenylyltransferase
MTGVGGFPGSFNPPTVAHLAIAEAAMARAGLDGIDLIVSRLALGKEAAAGPSLADRLAVLESVAASRPWLAVRLTDKQLVADIVDGYEVAILGADKWAQINDPAWYGGSVAARDAAVARLPRLLIAPRGSAPWADQPVGRGAEALEIAPHHRAVSSTAVRAGRREWMVPEAAAFDVETGAWSDGQRYAAWRASRDRQSNHEAGTSAQ